jgi:hypothetical protein
MKKFIPLLVALALLATPALAFAGGGGFDQYGYNAQARIFVGTGSSWCSWEGFTPNCMDGYSNDMLVMKWNAAWDLCNVTGLPADCAGAWTDNEWNGNVPGGSGVVWHYKIVWVGPCGADGTILADGGYCIWGSYEVLTDQGLDPSIGHSWFAHAMPNGYGVPRP